MSVHPFIPPSRLDQITGKIRTAIGRVVRDVAAIQKWLIEAREECRREGRNWNAWCLSGECGIQKAQIYRYIDGKTNGHSVSPGDVSQDDGGKSNRSPGAAAHVPRAVNATRSNEEYYLPEEVFIAMGITPKNPFDIDVASPGREVVPWVPARKHYTRRENGLLQPWPGFIYCNPPHGIDAGAEDWIERFLQHPDGIFLTADWTSTKWWKRLAQGSDATLFVCPKIQFVRPSWIPIDERGQNTLGTTFFARGERSLLALRTAEANGRGTLLYRR
jgi:hypothetical protein